MASILNNLRYVWNGIWQQFNSRKRIMEQLRTLALVVPLTLLIWVYAERAQPGGGTATVVIGVSIPPPLTAAVVEPSNGLVQITMKGQRSDCEKLKDDLAADQRLDLALPDSYAHVGETQTVNLQDLLNNNATIRSHRVTIDSVSPSLIKVSVDNLESRPVDLAAPAVPQLTFQHVSFDPPQVVLRGPQAVVEGEVENNQKIYVDLSDLSGIVNTQGTTQTIDVPVTPPRDSKLSVTPAKVKMTFQVASREIDYTVPSVAVVVQRPIAQEGRYTVKATRPLVQNVQIHGPVDQVHKFQTDPPLATLTAVLSVTSDDVGKDLEREVKFVGMPPGVTVMGGPYNVDFQVLDANSTER